MTFIDIFIAKIEQYTRVFYLAINFKKSDLSAIH